MTAARSATQNQSDKRDHRREVTDSIIKMLEDGVAPWQKPWECSAMPFNPTTERSYRGGNAVHLLATGIGREYVDPRWMTYKQAAEQGWQVRKGEKGTHIEFWEVKERSDEKGGGPDQNGGEPPAKENGQRLIHRVYTVFNARQIDGIPEYQPKQRTQFEAVRAGERILTNSGARIEHDQLDSAFYNRRSDSIHLPPKDAFKDAPGYYGTALHEVAHWTGHPSRLNRSTLSDSYRFGDLNYAKEELRAELASVFMAAELGVPHDPANHAAYVGSWIKALREDKNEIFRAAHEASTATDFVLSLDREVSRAEALGLPDSGGAGSLQCSEAPLGASEGISASDKETRHQIEAFHADRALASDAADRHESHDNGSFIAQDEPGTGTVRPHAKESAPAHTLAMGHNVRQSDDSPDRTTANTGNLVASFAAAKQITADALGESARTFPAQTQSGRYNGRIIGETAHHVVQLLSPKTAVAHMKHHLEHIPLAGENTAIAYSKGHAQVRDLRERANTQELGR
jgi:antirestriction protein ArdC